MNTSHNTDTDELVRRAAQGDRSARGALLERHRDRLTRMVSVRIDPQLARRVDPSDVVQETLATAEKRLDNFLNDPPIAYYVWLRRLALDKLVDIRRKHVQAKRRSVQREQEWVGLSDASVKILADQLPVNASTPSQRLIRAESHQQVKHLLKAIDPTDREILVMRHLEGMSVKEISEVLDKSEGTIKRRHFHALKNLRSLLARE